MIPKRRNNKNDDSLSESSLSSSNDKNLNERNVVEMEIGEPKQAVLDKIAVYKLIHEKKCKVGKLTSSKSSLKMV